MMVRAGFIFSFLLMVMSFIELNAQTVINEELRYDEIEYSEAYLNTASSDELPIEWYHRFRFFPKISGELKVALFKAFSFEEPINEEAFFEIFINSESSKKYVTIPISDLLGDPIQNALHFREQSQWFL